MIHAKTPKIKKSPIKIGQIYQKNFNCFYEAVNQQMTILSGPRPIIRGTGAFYADWRVEVVEIKQTEEGKVATRRGQCWVSDIYLQEQIKNKKLILKKEKGE